MTLSTAAPAQVPTLIVELEGGPAWQSYNDVEIPNDGSATRFSLSELAGTGPWPAGRRDRQGYRTVEGGADVEAVYAFAWLHYAVVSLAWRR